MELKDTIEMMVSSDYQERFRAEYYQLKIRITKLQKMIDAYDNNALSFTPNGSINRFKYQLYIMRDYLHVLQSRALWEDIDLGEEVL